jgi:hypothetical protein
MLGDFLALADAKAASFAEYADRWGALGLDKHGEPQGWEAHPKREQIEHWRRWAREADAMFAIGDAINRGHGVPDSARELLIPADRTVPWSTRAGESLIDGRNLARHINRWVSLGAVRLEFRWPAHEGEPAWAIRSPHLFGALALALAGALTRSLHRSTGPDVAICSNCGLPYVPNRQPAKGRRNFCDRPGCGKNAAWRLAKRDERSRS